MFFALTGTIGAGKNTVADYLVRRHGFKSAYGSQILKEKALSFGLEPTRPIMRNLANQLRANYPNAIIEATIQAVENKPRSLIGFLRTRNEVIYLRKRAERSILIAIDASQLIRYQRTQHRNELKDRLTYSQFIEMEELEMNSIDPNKQNVSYCIKASNYIIQNNGSLQDLYKKLDKLVERLR